MSGFASRKRAYILMPALLVFIVAGLYAIVLARYGLLDVTSARRESLEACTEQVLQSARAWAAANADQLVTPRELPITELLPPSATGHVVLERGADPNGNPVIVSRRMNRTQESPLVFGGRP
jgi:hypothetical protein